MKSLLLSVNHQPKGVFVNCIRLRLSSLVTFLPAVCLVFFTTLSLVRAASGDEHWDNQFGWPGPGGNNYAITTHNGRIFVSGLAQTTNVAVQVWDGVQWSAIGQFYGPTLSSVGVYDLAFVGDTLYAAGIFTNVDGVSANGLARWDGTNWSSVGFSGSAYSLAVDGGNLYVGGGFSTNLSGLAMENIARWDGANWSALGNGLGNISSGIVYSIVVTNGTVYAGGYFTNSGALFVTNVAAWNGVSWSALGSGLTSSLVFSLAFYGSQLCVAGQSGSSSAGFVAGWDGTNWTALGGGFNQRVQSIASFNNTLSAVGYFTSAGVAASYFAVWNGSTWSAAGSGLSSAGVRVCSAGTNVYVSGNFLAAGGSLANGFASWDGSRWGSLGTPGRMNGVSSGVKALASDGTNLYGGGLFNWAGQTNASQVARWDGANWFPLGSGFTGVSGSVGCIAVAHNDVYVGGSFTSMGGTPLTEYIAGWDGTNWFAMGNNTLSSGAVSDIAVLGTNVFATGAFTFTDVSNHFALMCARWDGMNWLSVAPSPFAAAIYSMNVVAVQDTNIFFGGNFYAQDPATFPGNFFTTNIARYDGAHWYPLGTGVNSNVVAMTSIGTNLYVAGLFTNASGLTVNQIARWDGNSWNDVGGGVVGRGTINALASIGADLYAGGTFTNVGGVTAARIAKWDGSHWSALGSGVSSTVLALNSVGNDLFAGGAFRTAGGKISNFFGRWNSQTNFNIPQLLNPTRLPNGLFGARLWGVVGVTNLIEATTNFSVWTPILTNATGIYDFTDPAAPAFPARFYRATLAQ